MSASALSKPVSRRVLLLVLFALVVGLAGSVLYARRVQRESWEAIPPGILRSLAVSQDRQREKQGAYAPSLDALGEADGHWSSRLYTDYNGYTYEIISAVDTTWSARASPRSRSGATSTSTSRARSTSRRGAPPALRALACRGRSDGSCPARGRRVREVVRALHPSLKIGPRMLGARKLGSLALLGICLALQGCAAFSDYDSDTRSARRSFESGDADAALRSLEDGVENELDGLCFSLERGVIAQAARQYALSIAELERAEKKIESFEDRGASPLGVSQYVGSILLNEKTIPYKGEDFERILLPVFNSRNYLFSDKLEDAMVEVRRTWIQQDRSKQLHEKELAAADAAATDRKVARGDLPGVERQVVYPPDVLGSPESVHEITYAHYLSALISERMANYQDAIVSMRAVAKIRPDLAFVRTDLARLSKLAGQQAPEGAASDAELPPEDSGSVALLFDCGWAPHKTELKVIFPTYRSLGSIAIPIYERSPNPARAARLVIGPYTSRTAVISDVDAIVFKYHRDHLPLIVLKQAIRAAVKIAEGEGTAYGVKEAIKAGKGKGREGAAIAELAGWGAGLAVGIVNIVTEQADLRAWLTLPQTFQAVRVFVPPGEYPARIELLGDGGGVLNHADLGVVTVKAGELRCVQARSVGTSLYATQPH